MVLLCSKTVKQFCVGGQCIMDHGHAPKHRFMGFMFYAKQNNCRRLTGYEAERQDVNVARVHYVQYVAL